MALGRYPIPPPNEKVLKMIFGDLYDPSKESHSGSSSKTITQSQNSTLTNIPFDSTSIASSIQLINTNSTSSTSSTSSPMNKNFDYIDAVPPLSIFAQLDYIVTDPPPTVPISVFSAEFKSFVDSCLKKNPADRPDLNGLMVKIGLYLYIFFN